GARAARAARRARAGGERRRSPEAGVLMQHERPDAAEHTAREIERSGAARTVRAFGIGLTWPARDVTAVAAAAARDPQHALGRVRGAEERQAIALARVALQCEDRWQAGAGERGGTQQRGVRPVRAVSRAREELR